MQWSIFWPKFLIFSPSWKRGKLISSLFFAAFLRRNFSSDCFFRKKSARELFKYRNLSKKGVLMREARNFFRFCPLNCLKYMKKAKKCLIIVKNIIREELISSLFPCFFSKCIFIWAYFYHVYLMNQQNWVEKNYFAYWRPSKREMTVKMTFSDLGVNRKVVDNGQIYLNT